MKLQFRKAVPEEIPVIWEILQQAIRRRKSDGSNQWQDGYPNRDVVQGDIDRGVGFVLTTNDAIIGYSAVIINDEPEYARIRGRWNTNGDFVVIHRIAISDGYLGQGLAGEILNFAADFARSKGIYSLRADTNYDNPAMLRTFLKLGFVYCGEVYFRGSARLAYEKVLKDGVPD